METSITSYTGRFAPSPSGHLHFGSLVTALGSYLRAKSQQGKWLVRMEDLDPPREMQGATKHILQTLEDFGLNWDGEVLYQSQRHEAYQHLLDAWLSSDQAYYCSCTRKRITELGGIYDGYCHHKNVSEKHSAIRLVNTEQQTLFYDELLGEIHVPKDFASEDYILKRRDGLYAYQLAVVADDAAQGITEVVRGSDLLTSSMHQHTLFGKLKTQAPKWLHLPLVVSPDGRKLSKQNHAEPLDRMQPKPLLIKALAVLNQPTSPDLLDFDLESLLHYAVKHFDMTLIPKSNQTQRQN
mgnify:CR=1 FL=1|tara:strand:- start:2711 stop:3598 length:888 start_codon:yes stop_codon:yes gene_type:complete